MYRVLLLGRKDFLFLWCPRENTSDGNCTDYQVKLGLFLTLSSPELRKYSALSKMMVSKPIHAGLECRFLAFGRVLQKDCVVTHTLGLLCMMTVLRVWEALSRHTLTHTWANLLIVSSGDGALAAWWVFWDEQAYMHSCAFVHPQSVLFMYAFVFLLLLATANMGFCRIERSLPCNLESLSLCRETPNCVRAEAQHLWPRFSKNTTATFLDLLQLCLKPCFRLTVWAEARVHVLGSVLDSSGLKQDDC